MIIRKNKTGNYSQVDNALWTDKRLSVSARFILGFMLSLPDDWRFNISWIAKQIGMNRDTVGKYVQELIDNGFIMRDRVRHDDGTFGDYEYTIYEEPAVSTCAGSTCAEDIRTTKTDKPLTKTDKKNVVVEQAANIIEYPSAIIETLSRHDLKPNAATLKRWLSLASEEVIVHVIEYAAGRNVRSIIGYITAVLQQGYVKERSRAPRERHQPVKRDKLPDYVQRQIESQHMPQTVVGEISEAERQEAYELLRALGEI